MQDLKRPIAPRNRKATAEVPEDGPVYVLEDGRSISAAEFKNMAEGRENSEELDNPTVKPNETSFNSVNAAAASKAKTQDKDVIIGSRKRKAGKFIGDEMEEGSEVSVGKEARDAREQKPKDKMQVASQKKKRKNMGGAVKLSFGEE